VTEQRLCEAADGTLLAWRETGHGPPLVLVNGVTTTDVAWGPLLARWSRRFRVISWDYKGHGASGPARGPEAVALSTLADDLRRVMDAAGVTRAPVPLIGYSMGSQVALEACRRMPDRVAAMVSVLGPARRMLDTAFGGIPGRAIGAMLSVLPEASIGSVGALAKVVARAPWTYRAGRIMGLYGTETQPGDVAGYVAHFQRLHTPTVRWMVLAAARHDASAVLAAMPAPLLIVAGGRDAFAPAHRVGHVMHAMAPGSVLLDLPDGTHGSPFGHADRIGAAVEQFLADVGVGP
jgi:pimeloyl-ACP methyl ester carboxylesterase